MRYSTVVRGSAVFTFAFAVLLVPAAEAQLPVIPGIYGFGVDTPAGRGGRVIRVTNLEASGEGSLDACARASGPRICVFEVSGTIRMTRNLHVAQPFITIAGQTAPSPGINIRGAGISVSTHDVLIQHLRVRVGDDLDGPAGTNRDGLGIANEASPPYNVVIDHCSFSWSIDEAISTWYEVGDITFR